VTALLGVPRLASHSVMRKAAEVLLFKGDFFQSAPGADQLKPAGRSGSCASAAGRTFMRKVLSWARRQVGHSNPQAVDM